MDLCKPDNELLLDKNSDNINFIWAGRVDECKTKSGTIHGLFFSDDALYRDNTNTYSPNYLFLYQYGKVSTEVLRSLLSSTNNTLTCVFSHALMKTRTNGMHNLETPPIKTFAFLILQHWVAPTESTC